MSYARHNTPREKARSSFVRGFRLWVRFGARPARAGAVQDGFDFAAAKNDYGGGNRPTESDAAEWADDYLAGTLPHYFGGSRGRGVYKASRGY